MGFIDEGSPRWETCEAGGSGAVLVNAETEDYLLVVGSKAPGSRQVSVQLTNTATAVIYGVTNRAKAVESVDPYSLANVREVRIKRGEKLRCRVTTPYNESVVTDALVAIDATINARAYKGAHTTAPAHATGNQVILLLDNNGAASSFQRSQGNTAYANMTVAQALGTTGKFLGSITGAESGSSGVNSLVAARAYFDADTSRYNTRNTYYYFDGSALKTLTYTPAPDNFGDKITPSAKVGQEGWGVMGSSGIGRVVDGETIDGKHYADFWFDESM